MKRFALIVLALSIPMSYNACGKFESAGQSSNSSLALLSEPVQFDRTTVPYAAKSSVTLSGSCANGLTINIQIDGVPQAETATCTGKQFSHLIQLPGADGPKVIVASVTETGGNVRQDSVTVIKDNASPAISILNVVPQNGYVVVNGTCETGLAIAHGGDILTISAASCTNGMFQLSASLTQTAGAKVLNLSQTDRATNVGSASITWNPDNSAPALAVTAPLNNAFVGAAAALAGVCEAGIAISLSGTAMAAPQQVACPMGSFSLNINIAGADGAKTLVVAQTDGAGNKSEVSLALTKDTIPPVLTIASPLAGAVVSTSSVTISGACESGLAVRVQGAGVSAPVQMTCAANAYSLSAVLTAGTGTKEIQVQQTDAAGNTASVARNITSSAPPSSLTITAPAANSLSKGSITLTGACDNGGVLAFSGDIAAVTNVTCAGGAYSKVLTFSAAEGLKNVMVKQTLNGVESQASRSFTKDSVAPVLTIAAPAANATVEANFVVSGTCESGLTVVLAGSGLNATVNATCTNGSYNATVASSAGDGTKTFTATQTDAIANTASVSRSVLRDTALPMLTISVPANNAVVMANITVSGGCEVGLPVVLSGAGLSATVNATCSAGMYSAPVVLSTGDGAKAFSAKQTDAAGNVATVNRSVVRDTVAPSLTIASPAAGTKSVSGLTIQGACESGLSVKASGTGVASEVTGACASNAYSLAITFSANDGVKLITVSSTDAAGNTASIQRQFEKETVVAPDPAANWTAAKAVITQYCLACHKAGGQAAYADLNLATEKDFVTKGFVVAGKPEESKIIYRLLHWKGAYMGAANMPLGYNSTSFPISAYNTLEKWIREMKTDTQTEVPVGFSCTDPNLRAASLSYTLTKLQYNNTLTDLFGAAIVAQASDAMSTLPEDAFDATTNRRLNVLSTAAAEAYFLVGKAIANGVVNDAAKLASVFGSCASVATPATNCIDTYLNSTARKIFRRPLTTEEFSFAKNIANRSGDYKANLKTVLALHLTSPAFIWRVELGNATQSTPAKTDLTPYEVATRISYMAADTLPDDTLFAAAANNQLATVAQVQAQVKRILQTAAGRAKTKRTLLKWSMNDKAPDFTVLPDVAGINKAGLGQAMMDEAAKYVEESIYTQSASFKTLITSKTSYASNASLATIYEHAPVSGTASAQFGGRRQGLLMRAPAYASARTRTPIIRRGVDFRKRFLCNEIPPPTSDVVDLRDEHELTFEQKLNYSNRDAIAYQTSPAVCMSCHAAINPTGFAFENMDPFGRIRVQEPIYDLNNQLVRSLPVVTSASVPLPSGGNITAQDGFDLVSHVANSSEGPACFTRYAYRYVNERRESAEDDCQLDTVHKLTMDQNKPLLDVMTELIGNSGLFVKTN